MNTDKISLGAVILGVAIALTGTTLFSSSESNLAPQSTPPDTTQTKRLRLLMVGLAQDMARINTGLWHEDYDLMQQGGASIANHPKIPPEQMAKIKKALGNQFETFVQFDQTVHKTAAELAEAAANRNLSKVLDTYTRIRNGCVGCHTAYRERLRPVLAPNP